MKSNLLIWETPTYIWLLNMVCWHLYKVADNMRLLIPDGIEIPTWMQDHKETIIIVKLYFPNKKRGCLDTRDLVMKTYFPNVWISHTKTHLKLLITVLTKIAPNIKILLTITVIMNVITFLGHFNTAKRFSLFYNINHITDCVLTRGC